MSLKNILTSKVVLASNFYISNVVDFGKENRNLDFGIPYHEKTLTGLPKGGAGGYPDG